MLLSHHHRKLKVPYSPSIHNLSPSHLHHTSIHFPPSQNLNPSLLLQALATPSSHSLHCRRPSTTSSSDADANGEEEEVTRTKNSFWAHYPNPRHTITTLSNHRCSLLCRASMINSSSDATANADGDEVRSKKKSFWAAVSLIIGTAVGPGMLGLPSATLRSGPLPSTATILLSWLYVVSSIVLVAELSFAAMEDDGVDEVSFTALAARTLGPKFGAAVAAVYASLSFSLLIACVSGIGSLALQQFPWMNPVVAHALFPCFVGVVIGFFPFKAIDVANRLLCALMLCSITALVGIGLSVGRRSLLSSLACASWRPEAILPAIPVTVLTLGFHVVTPFVCKIVGDSMYDARKAIIFGGAVPLAMVLLWNFIVLGLAGSGKTVCSDPIKLLLSMNPAALPAVQGFAFTALATSLIGYTVSFPKQLADTVALFVKLFDKKHIESCNEEDQSKLAAASRTNKNVYFSSGMNQEGAIGFLNQESEENYSESTKGLVRSDADTISTFVTWTVLLIPIFIASFFPAAFGKALDFAGVYANCFLFGVLPPAMAWIHRTRKRSRSSASRKDLLPGGTIVLGILFGVAILLGVWH